MYIELLSNENALTHYQLNENLVFTVDSNYLNDILKIKRKIQKAYCEFLMRPSSVYIYNGICYSFYFYRCILQKRRV